MKQIRNCSAKFKNYRVANIIWYFRQNTLLVKFAIVGVCGTFVNLALMALLVEFFATPHIYASFTATEISIIHNFLLNNSWTFSSRNHTRSRLKRFCHFNLLSAGTLAVNVYVSTCLVGMGIPYIPAQGCGIIAAFGINYLINNHLIFADSTSPEPPLQRLKKMICPEKQLPGLESMETDAIHIQPDGQ
jgi:dolichol-phosphate mannosyltransferase